jgi:hypothetical protein
MDMSPKFLLWLLATGEHPPYRIVQDAVPGDAEIIGCEHEWHGRVRLYIWSATFEPVPEGKEPPLLLTTEQSIEIWPTEESKRLMGLELDRINERVAV